jgi:hypothetical protein
MGSSSGYSAAPGSAAAWVVASRESAAAYSGAGASEARPPALARFATARRVASTTRDATRSARVISSSVAGACANGPSPSSTSVSSLSRNGDCAGSRGIGIGFDFGTRSVGSSVESVTSGNCGGSGRSGSVC